MCSTFRVARVTTVAFLLDSWSAPSCVMRGPRRRKATYLFHLFMRFMRRMHMLSSNNASLQLPSVIVSPRSLQSLCLGGGATSPQTSCGLDVKGMAKTKINNWKKYRKYAHKDRQSRFRHAPPPSPVRSSICAVCAEKRAVSFISSYATPPSGTPSQQG